MQVVAVESVVDEQGNVKVETPAFPPGSRVRVIVLPGGGEFNPRYPLWGTESSWDDPLGPTIPEDEWGEP